MLAIAAGYKPDTDGYREFMRVQGGIAPRATNAAMQSLEVDINGVPTRVTFDPRTGRYAPAQIGGGQPMLQQSGVPFRIDPSLPPEVQASIRNNELAWSQADEMPVAPPAMPIMGRRKEDEARAVTRAQEEAKIGVQLGNAGAVSEVEAQAAAAKAKAEADAKAAAERDSVAAGKQVDANRTLSLLDEAEKIIPFSTGSRLGAMVDQGAALFGESTPGAQAVARLQTIAGQLTSSMPRMQGPQSDRDVELYRQMAGDLANPNLPRETRLAALQTIRRLNEKYAGGQAQAPRPAAGRKLRFNPKTGKIE